MKIEDVVTAMISEYPFNCTIYIPFSPIYTSFSLVSTSHDCIHFWPFWPPICLLLQTFQTKFSRCNQMSEVQTFHWVHLKYLYKKLQKYNIVAMLSTEDDNISSVMGRVCVCNISGGWFTPFPITPTPWMAWRNYWLIESQIMFWSVLCRFIHRVSQKEQHRSFES